MGYEGSGLPLKRRQMFKYAERHIFYRGRDLPLVPRIPNPSGAVAIKHMRLIVVDE